MDTYNKISVKLLLAIVIIAACIVVFVRWQLELRSSRKLIVLDREMGQFVNVLRMYGAYYDQVPGPDLKSALKTIHSTKPFSNYLLHDETISGGRDPWGTPFVYVVDTHKRHAVFMSYGPNRIDDHGYGDDLKFEIDIEDQ
jgi:hypothetical protein